MDDLFAELDSRDKQSQQEPESVTELLVPAEERAGPDSKKQSSKVRHLARQVGATRNVTQDCVHSKAGVGTKGGVASSERSTFEP